MRFIIMLLCLFSLSAQAETLTFVVHTTTSQPFYIAQVLGKYIGKHYPGQPEVIIKGIPGANGLNAANYLYSVAPKDGLTFGSFTKEAVLISSVDKRHAKFDADKFVWIGSLTDGRTNPGVIIANDKYQGNLINMAEMGTAEGSNVDAIRKLTGWNIKKIAGYRDTREIRLAFARKEIDAFFIQYATILATEPELKNKIIIQYGNGLLRNPELRDVPTLMELADSSEHRYMLAVRELCETLARPLVMPPGVPKEKASQLREAFFRATNDSEYRKEILYDISPIYWDQADSIIKQIESIDKEIVKSLAN